MGWPADDAVTIERVEARFLRLASLAKETPDLIAALRSARDEALKEIDIDAPL